MRKRKVTRKNHTASGRQAAFERVAIGRVATGAGAFLRSWARKEGAWVSFGVFSLPTANKGARWTNKEGQIDEMGEAREAQYALECVLVRLTEAELRRVIDDLPPRAREYIKGRPRRPR